MNKLRAALPNFITLLNLSLGVLAILVAVNSESDNSALIPASILILAAALTDRFDGKLARKLKVDSEMGKQLDSLADLISFGVAPAIIAWKTAFVGLGFPGYLLTIIFPIAGAYRLARYNVTAFDEFFRGLPITIAGAFISLVNLYNCRSLLKEGIPPLQTGITVVILLALSFLMVSRIKMRKI